LWGFFVILPSYFFIIFDVMEVAGRTGILYESIQLISPSLGRTLRVDLYLPDRAVRPQDMSVLLINDGQDLEKLGLSVILGDLYGRGILSPLLCVGIHAGADRKKEYGVAAMPDYLGRGSRAGAYRDFIFSELLPHIYRQYNTDQFKEKAFAGFSLGALSALDIVWGRPQEFSRVGLFSGSFWWRKKDKEDPAYNEEADRIMHRQVREGNYYPGLKFFFECGTADEQEDRNHNGVIDSIDDTQDLMRELEAKGYERGKDIRYLQLEGGRHDVATWAQAMPEFLKWGWGNK
jgi:enterochelin esterase-like enzyme